MAEKRVFDPHSGRIRFESTPGEGSTFLFILPAAGTVIVRNG